jgi:hypothetical protein
MQKENPPKFILAGLPMVYVPLNQIERLGQVFMIPISLTCLTICYLIRVNRWNWVDQGVLNRQK